jgi:hypothetical protein
MWRSRLLSALEEASTLCGRQVELQCSHAACVVTGEVGSSIALLPLVRRPAIGFERLGGFIGLPTEWDRCHRAAQALHTDFHPLLEAPRVATGGRCHAFVPTPTATTTLHAVALCAQIHSLD